MLISIVIPAHNEAESLQNLLASIKQYLSISCEILVVDNGSTDSTAEIARANNVKLISLPEKVFPAVARNVGGRQAVGEILVFLDGDTRVTAPWCARLVQQASYLCANPMIMTGARVIPPEPERMSWIERFWFGPMVNQPVNYLNGANIITTAQAWQKLNGMDESLATGEDYELTMRARANGIEVIVDNAFKLIHDGYPKNLLNFYRRERWHGKGDAKNWMTVMRSKVAVLSLLFSASLLLAFFAVFFGILPVYFIVFPVVIPLLCAYHRFNRSGPRVVLVNTFLFAVYLVARAVSVVHCRIYRTA